MSLCACKLTTVYWSSVYANTCSKSLLSVGLGAGKFGQASQRMALVRLHFQHHGLDVADSAKAAARDRPDLRALAGLRALACLAILAGHLAYWVAAANPDKRKVPILDAADKTIFAWCKLSVMLFSFLFVALSVLFAKRGASSQAAAAGVCLLQRTPVDRRAPERL